MIHPQTKVHTVARNVIAACAEAHGVTYEAVVSPSRKAAAVAARHTAMWLLRHRLRLSCQAVGLIIGGRDHSTVVSASQSIEGYMRNGDYVGVMARELEATLFGPDGAAVIGRTRADVHERTRDIGERDRALWGTPEALNGLPLFQNNQHAEAA
jgi:hypothetical protein